MNVKLVYKVVLSDIIKKQQYTRLNIITKLKSLGNLQEYLVQAEKEGFISAAKAAAIREEFDLPQNDQNTESEETIVFQEQ